MDGVIEVMVKMLSECKDIKNQKGVVVNNPTQDPNNSIIIPKKNI